MTSLGVHGAVLRRTGRLRTSPSTDGAAFRPVAKVGSATVSQMLWFGVLYLCSIAAFASLITAVRGFLKLV